MSYRWDLHLRTAKSYKTALYGDIYVQANWDDWSSIHSSCYVYVLPNPTKQHCMEIYTYKPTETIGPQYMPTARFTYCQILQNSIVWRYIRTSQLRRLVLNTFQLLGDTIQHYIYCLIVHRVYLMKAIIFSRHLLSQHYLLWNINHYMTTPNSPSDSYTLGTGKFVKLSFNIELLQHGSTSYQHDTTNNLIPTLATHSWYLTTRSCIVISARSMFQMKLLFIRNSSWIKCI